MQYFKTHYLQSGITKRMMENLLTRLVALGVINKNLRQIMKREWRVSSRPVTNLSILMDGLYSFLPTSIPMHGRRSFQRSYARVLWLMVAGPSRRRWAIALVRCHRLRGRPLSG